MFVLFVTSSVCFCCCCSSSSSSSSSKNKLLLRAAAAAKLICSIFKRLMFVDCQLRDHSTLFIMSNVCLGSSSSWQLTTGQTNLCVTRLQQTKSHGEPFVTSNVVAVVFIIVLCLFEYRLLTPYHFLSSSKLIMFVIPFCAAAAATLSVSVCLLNWKSLTRYLNVLLKKLNNKWRKQLGCLKIIWLLRCCCSSSSSSSSSNSDKTYIFLFFCSCCIFLQPCQMFFFFSPQVDQSTYTQRRWSRTTEDSGGEGGGGGPLI